MWPTGREPFSPPVDGSVSERWAMRPFRSPEPIAPVTTDVIAVSRLGRWRIGCLSARSGDDPIDDRCETAPHARAERGSPDDGGPPAGLLSQSGDPGHTP